MIVCGIRNHYPAENLEGHSFPGRLSEKEEKLVVDLSKTLVRLRDILNTLNQRNDLNVSTLRTIYNVRYKFKVMEYARRSQMQELLKNLSEHVYIEIHRCCPDTDTVKIYFGLTRLALICYVHFPGS